MESAVDARAAAVVARALIRSRAVPSRPRDTKIVVGLAVESMRWCVCFNHAEMVPRNSVCSSVGFCVVRRMQLRCELGARRGW